MTPHLKAIWHLFNLCAIGFALAVGGSTGFSIFPSKEPLSAFPPLEAQNLGYILSAAPFSNGSAVQPPLTSHSFGSSPPGPENFQPLPHLPSTVTVSPTQSAAAAAPTAKSPGPDASIKAAPSKEPPLPAPPPPGVPSHDLTFQQPAPSPLHHLAPQNPARVYAPPPVVVLPGVPALQSPAVPPRISSPLLPVAPYASAPPQARSAVQPPLTSHSFGSSPPGPENFQPLPHLPSTVTVSPTQSAAAAAPTAKSPGPDASIKAAPSKEPPLPAPPPPGVPSHDLTFQQPAPSPLHHLAPQNPARVYAPPPVVVLPGVPALQSPAVPPRISSPLLPVAPYASAPPQARSAVQSPLTSHSFGSSPPGPENIQPLPHLPSTVTVSPTQSAAAAAPTAKSPDPDASIKAAPSKEPPLPAPPPPGVPSHDLTFQQPAPSPLHHLAPQNPARVYAPPPVVVLPSVPALQSPAIPPRISSPLPPVAPYASAPPQARSAVQPPLTSHSFGSSPPGPENIQPLPHLPSTVTVSPTQSAAAAAPTAQSPGPDASIKAAPSKEPPLPAPPPPGVPSHDLTFQQPAPSPLHHLAPQNPARVYAPPPVVVLPSVPALQSPAIPPRISSPLPPVAPYASAPPQARSAVQPPLTSHSFESSPPGPENIQPLPHLPSTVTVSPTQSAAAAAPTAKSPGPDASIKAAPSKEPLLPTPPPPEVPSHDLTFQQPAPSPLHHLAPQNPARVYAPPPVVVLPSIPALQSPAIPPRISSPLPPVAPYASAPPQASVSLRASSPASTAVPSRFSSLPPSVFSPHTLVSPPPVMLPHIFASPPPASPFILPTPSVPPPPSLAAPPLLPSEHASAPSIVATPSHTVASSPTHPKTLHHFTSPSPVASSPPFVPLEVMPSSDSAPPPSITQLPAVPPFAFAPPKPPLLPHSSTPPQATPSRVTVPPVPSTIPPITIPPPSKPHFLAPPPTSMPYVSAPPPNSTVTEHSSAQSPPAPMLASNPPPDGVPHTVSSSAPKAAPSPPASSHFLAPPPSSMPSVSAPPPNGTLSAHSSSSPPPSPPIHVSNPPPHAVPPIVSPPAPGAASSPPAESRFSAPPPSIIPTSSPASKNASSPPTASAPSTAAVPPVTATPPSIHTVTSGSLPPGPHQRKIPKSQTSPAPSKSLAPLAASPVRSPSNIPVVPREPPSIPPEAQLPRVSSPALSIHQRGHQVPVTIAPSGPTYSLSPTDHPEQGISPYIAPSVHESKGLPSLAPVATILPPTSPSAEAAHSPSFSPLPSTSKAPETSSTVPSPAPQQHGQLDRPYSLLAPSPESAQRYHSPTSHHPAMAPSHSPSTEDYISPVPMSDMPVPSGHSMTPFFPPEISPSTRKPELAPPILALPPPPPNRDCLSYTCLEPYTNTIAGSPCGCVLPMKVELRIGVALYTFFPLVPELAQEVATGIFLEPSQVRIMGANAASEQPDKTLLLIDLVPLGDKFDNITAFLIYERFWNKQVAISNSLFGGYEVLYVQYPGLPPSPPMAPSDIAVINGDPYPGDNGSKMHPLGVDVTKQGRKHRLSGSLIAIIVLAAFGAVLLCFLLGWILLFRHRRQVNQSAEAPHVYPASIARSTGPTGQSAGSHPSFSPSFESSVAAYTGSAKTFSAAEIEKATDNLNSSRVLGEGGFGRVYSGVLEDGTEVAVKVLKREDQQGGREFLAEVEMLSRLHHRNLVKLIGICVEEHVRCIVYELVPNGSVESHLHGIDRQISPLDWAARMKIALGAARGLAYLHEDSSPRVIHRDFKASNILLEADFTPKVSDFGLARTALDEENTHISTRVMGTFGYVAPEYAMTGHLLVKSDVYSYGVVLLELLTGRKPVDMSQPPGQENLVSWTRPYLTSKEALKSIVDADLGPDISFDSMAKVAAIASMCVQPEVSHRPFMGEVVQALKLVCNECGSLKDECDELPGSRGHEDLLNEAQDPSQSRYSAHSYGSGRNGEDLEKGLSASDFGLGCKEPESIRRHSSSGPIGGGRSWRFWKRARMTTSREAVGEHGMYRFWSGSH